MVMGEKSLPPWEEEEQPDRAIGVRGLKAIRCNQPFDYLPESYHSGFHESVETGQSRDL